MSIIAKIGIALGMLLLSACASLQTATESNYSKTSRAQLYNVKDWFLAGRIAVIATNDSWSANIEWHHLPASERIKLFGPLGQGAVIIELANGVVTIDRGGGKIQKSTQPEQFISQQLGLSVPIESLRFWAIGLPEPGRERQETADGFVQDGWLVTYKAMQPIQNTLIPQKMAVSNNQIKLKLIVDQWDLDGGKLN